MFENKNVYCKYTVLCKTDTFVKLAIIIVLFRQNLSKDCITTIYINYTKYSNLCTSILLF